jgi:hypothetical protein
MHPERYHGHGRRPPFFEGWYYKLVDASEQFRYAVIPGIYASADPAEYHAFVQVLDGTTGHAAYHRYPPDAFRAARDTFDVHIGPNRFTADAISLDITSCEQAISGKVRFEGRTPWPVTLSSPGIMGWYSWVPFMECYHGVISLDHALYGEVAVDGQRIDWTGGRGYIEKDWGVSFPAAWVWLQSNHFSQAGTSITASVATIPWLWSTFQGFIIGLWHEGRLVRFATYTGASIDSLEVEDNHVRWAIHDRSHRLEIQAMRAAEGALRGPGRADMGVRVPETLQATVRVRLLQRRKGTDTVLLDDTGRHAGLEVVGDLGRLRS